MTFDTTRADRFGYAGYALARTATVDRLAAEGVVCSDAAAAAPITMPSHTTIMTGLLPPAHGVRDNGAYALSPEAITLAEVLAAQDFETRAFVSAQVLSRRYGLDQGFDDYDDDLYAEDDPRLFMIRDRSAARTVDRAIDWYRNPGRSDDARPFFVWLHFFDPHQPYHPPADLRALTANAYDAEIAAADRALGRFVAELEAHHELDDTLIVVTADHGESLGEHGEKTHGVFIYDATVHVPLLFRAPGMLPAGRVYDAPVHLSDVMPTVLGLLGISANHPMQGADLSAALAGREPPVERPQYIESRLAELGFGMAPLHGIRSGGTKWIRAPRPELYDLTEDPHERTNLVETRPEQAALLDGELDRLISSSKSMSIGVVETQLTDETSEMLAALGYLALDEERRAVSGMDPKDGMEIYTRLEDARHLAQDERWAEAEHLARSIVDELPDHVSARNVLALCLVKQNRLVEAETEYKRSLQSEGHQPRVWSMLATLAILQGDLDTAESRADTALQMAPEFIEALAARGMVEMLRGNHEAAADWYEKGLSADPNHPRIHRRVGDLMYELERWPQALDAYRRTIERWPDDYRALIQAGNAARRMELWDESKAYFLKAAEVQPDAWVPVYNLACLAAVRNQPEEAVRWLETAIERGFRSVNLLMTDTDLDSIRNRDDFTEQLVRLQTP